MSEGNENEIKATLDRYNKLNAGCSEETAWEAMNELSELVDKTKSNKTKAEIKNRMAEIFKMVQDNLFFDAEDDGDVDAIAQRWAPFDNPEEPVIPLLAKASNFDTATIIEQAIQKVVSDVIKDQANVLTKLRERQCSTDALEAIEDKVSDQWSDVPLGANEALDSAVEKGKSDHPHMKRLLENVQIPHVTQTYTENKRARLAEE